MMAEKIDQVGLFDELDHSEGTAVMHENPIRVINMDNHMEFMAYSCAHMPWHWFAAMRLKWARDWSGANDLERKLWLIAVDICNRHGWKVPKGREYLRKMAGLAIAEVADPKRFNKPGSYLLRVAWMGCDRRNWDRTWQGRYELIYNEFDDWSNRAFRWMKIHPDRIYRHRLKYATKSIPRLVPSWPPNGSQLVHSAPVFEKAWREGDWSATRPEPKEPKWQAMGRTVLGVKG